MQHWIYTEDPDSINTAPIKVLTQKTLSERMPATFDIDINRVAYDFTSKVLASGENVVNAVPVLEACASELEIEAIMSKYLESFCIKSNRLFWSKNTNYVLFMNLEVRRPRVGSQSYW
jgi:hypothetical protein